LIESLIINVAPFWLATMIQQWKSEQSHLRPWLAISTWGDDWL